MIATPRNTYQMKLEKPVQHDGYGSMEDQGSELQPNHASWECKQWSRRNLTSYLRIHSHECPMPKSHRTVMCIRHLAHPYRNIVPYSQWAIQLSELRQDTMLHSVSEQIQRSGISFPATPLTMLRPDQLTMTESSCIGSNRFMLN